MKKIILLCITAAVWCILSTNTFNLSAKPQISENKNIIVEIDYGNMRPSRTIEVSKINGRTALEVLQTVAEVETHPVGEYVMVTSIDGVKGKRGDMAWYYTINGKSADKIAYSQIVDDAENIQWTYKKDVCSGKVD